MKPPFDLIALDADDTLWHNEHLYRQAHARVANLLAPYQPQEIIHERLHHWEIANLPCFGYGIKSYILSMVESAIEISDGRLSPRDIQSIVSLGREMLNAEIQPLDHVRETLETLSPHFPLMILTKGDLFEQELRIARSGLRSYFRFIEVVSEKTRAAYQRLLAKYAIDPRRFLMVGNSLKSDILPVLEIGGHAVYIHNTATWVHEHADPPPAGTPGYHELEHIGLLPGLLSALGNPTI